MFLRSYVFRRIARNIRAIERADASPRNSLKNFACSQCSTDATDVSQKDSETLGHDLLERTPFRVVGYRTTSDSEINDRELNLSDEPVIINRDALIRQKFSDALIDIDVKEPGPLETCKEDLSHVGPFERPKYNVASYADDSPTIQELVKLGVNLHKLEWNRDIISFLLTADFERDIKPYIRFLHDCGLPADRLAAFIDRNPMIFQQDMDDLHTRIRYLRAHAFSISMISMIVYRDPKWLSYDTKFIDTRLGYFQNTYKLRGIEVRYLASNAPTVITHKMSSLRENNFAIREEMGFDNHETKAILLGAPRIWTRARSSLVETFDYAHNVMKLSHSTIVKEPKMLFCRRKRLKARHTFLEHLNRAQYDPTKPMYVSPLTLVTGTDVEFCLNVAKCSTETYDLYLKSL